MCGSYLPGKSPAPWDLPPDRFAEDLVLTHDISCYEKMTKMTFPTLTNELTGEGVTASGLLHVASGAQQGTYRLSGRSTVHITRDFIEVVARLAP